MRLRIIAMVANFLIKLRQLSAENNHFRLNIQDGGQCMDRNTVLLHSQLAPFPSQVCSVLCKWASQRQSDFIQKSKEKKTKTSAKPSVHLALESKKLVILRDLYRRLSG